MCKAGDIIFIPKYEKNGISLSKHSFVVLVDEAGEIKGLDYDIACSVMSSFKDDEHKKRKLSHPENFPIAHNHTEITAFKNTNKDGFLKVDQLFYFNKEKINFIVIGSVGEEVFKTLIKYIEELKVNVVHIIDNL